MGGRRCLGMFTSHRGAHENLLSPRGRDWRSELFYERVKDNTVNTFAVYCLKGGVDKWAGLEWAAQISHRCGLLVYALGPHGRRARRRHR
jgi:hypothetical protein